MRVAACVVAVAALSGCVRGEVARVVDGEEIQGSYVPPEAYAAYAAAAVAEEEGRLPDAARGFAAAAAHADDAGIEARLGRVLCALSRWEEAREAFDRGLELDPRAAVVRREQTRCALRRGAAAEAISAGTAAVSLDPLDRESLVLLSDALELGGRRAEASALRDELSIRRPDAPGSIAAEARRPTAGAPDPTATVVPVGGVSPAVDVATLVRGTRPPIESIDDALARGDLDAASRLATAARLSLPDLATRALAHGHATFAEQLATRVARADPADGTAWCVAVAAAERAGARDAAAARLLAAPTRAPSPLAVLLFAELLLERGGPEAALSMVAPAALERERADPLEERVRRRLAAALAAAD